MRTKLTMNSPLVVGLITGLLAASFMTLFSGLTQGHWVPAIVGGVIGGTVFGAIMGPVLTRWNRRVLGELIDVPRADRLAVARASNRGPIPVDPTVRAAAAELARRSHAETMRTHRQSLVVILVFLALTTGLALTQPERWWWAGVAVWLVILAMLIVLPNVSGDASPCSTGRTPSGASLVTESAQNHRSTAWRRWFCALSA